MAAREGPLLTLDLTGCVMALTLADCSTDVALHCRGNLTKAKELSNEIRAIGRRAQVVKAGVGSIDEVKAMAGTIADSLGWPDIVVASAISQYKWTTVLEQDPADYEDQFSSCVLQAVHLAKAFIPAMQAKGRGRFICINTECTMQMTPTQSTYVAGKRGMDGVYRVLAREVGSSGTTVNQVAPGVRRLFPELPENPTSGSFTAMKS